MKKVCGVGFILVFGALSSAADPEITFSVSNEAKSGSDKIQFSVLPDHHFNLEAPSFVEAQSGGKWVKAEKLSIKGNLLTASWPILMDECRGVHAQLYVCDNKNTYCLPKGLEFHCQNGKWQSSDWKYRHVEKTEVTEAKDVVFIHDDSGTALKLAKEKHLPLFIDFFGIWCPPCNQLDETVFNTSEFKNFEKDFIFLKIDVDSPTSWVLKSKFRITGYPTIIFASEAGEEISRLIGYRPKQDFVSAMTAVLKNKDLDLEKRKKLAEDSDKEAFNLGLMLLEREEFFQAHYYLLKASRHWSISDIRRNKLMSAQVGVQGKGETPGDKLAYKKLLSHALEWYPRQIEVFDRASQLAEVSEELGDKNTAAYAHRTEIETANWYLAHPKAFKGTEFVRGDLYEVLGAGYDALDDKQKSLDAYAQGAQEYLKEIKKAGLDENSERGFNLERIYCLWKSGQVETAGAFYDKLENQFPEEFTFYYQHAKLLMALKQFKAASEKAQKAFSFSYGDNRLRVASVLAEAYQNDNNKTKALEVLTKALGEAQLPSDKNIRTYRYYDKLVQMKKKLEG